jgi:hypothetical protein
MSKISKRGKKFIQHFIPKNLKVSDHSEDLDIDRRTMWKEKKSKAICVTGRGGL